MRRRLFWGLLAMLMLLAACGGGDDDKDNGSSGGDVVSTDLPTPTTMPTATVPTINVSTPLPPVATDAGSQSDTTSSIQGEQATAIPTPFPTRRSGPTLPPTWTPTVRPSPTIVIPTAITPTEIPPTIERLVMCASFEPDYAQNLEQHFVNTDLTVYWFPVEATGITYVVELYNVAGELVLSMEIPETQITFTGDQFPTVGTYFWTVKAKQNGALVDCGFTENEIFVSG